jgi:phage terminase small subunit
MKLTPKQKAFCDYYIQLGNATEAAVKAGYSKKTARFIGQENLTKPYILAYIQEHMDSLDEKRILDADEALEFLTMIVRGELVETVVTASGKKVDRKPTIDQRIKAIDSLMKRFNVLASLKKMEAETEFIRERTKLLKGAAKDNSLLEALIHTVNEPRVVIVDDIAKVAQGEHDHT